MLNIFAAAQNERAFGVVALTALVNKQPYVPGQISRSGLFQSDGVSTLHVAIEEKHGDLALVAPTPRGGPGETTDNEKRNIRDLRIPHYQRDDSVMADEVQGVRAFGREGIVDESGRSDEFVALQDVIAAKTLKHANALDATLEHQRCGALKGLVVDKFGNVIYDLYQEYKLTSPAPTEFDFATASFPFRQACAAMQRSIEDSLDEEIPVDGLDAWCGPDFFEAALQNQEYRSTFLNTPAAAALRDNAYTQQFSYGGINFMRYRTGRRAAASAAPQVGNSPTGFIGPAEVRFVPRVPGMFLTRFAPADYWETVNTKGLPRYAKQSMKKNDKGLDLEVQMNAISWATRPEALRGGFATIPAAQVIVAAPQSVGP